MQDLEGLVHKEEKRVKNSRFGRILRKVSRNIKYAALVGLACTALATSVKPAKAVNLHFEIEKTQQEKNHIDMVDQTVCRILYRTASPIPLNRLEDFKKLQRQFLDLSNPKEMEFLNQAQTTTDKSKIFTIFTKPFGSRIKKSGFMYDLKAQNKYLLFESIIKPGKRGIQANKFHVIPTAADIKQMVSTSVMKQESISGVRRHPSTGIIISYFTNNVFPTTIQEIVLNRDCPDFVRRAESAVDYIYGQRPNGRPALSEVQYSLPSIVDTLYLHLKNNEDVVLWSGPFGTKAGLKRANSSKTEMTLKKSTKVSVLTANSLTGAVAYNQRDLSTDEVKKILRRLPSTFDLDILVVDPTRDNNVHFRTVEADNTTIGILSSALWQNVTNEESIARFNITPVKLTDELKEIVLDNSMVELPKGTKIIYGDYNRIGINIRKPQQMPVAQYIADTVMWISSDKKELDRIVSSYYPISIGDAKLTRSSTDGRGRTFHKTIIAKKPGKLAPIIMLAPGKEFIEMRFGVNWVNPWIKAINKMNKRRAYGMSYDSKTGKFIYHDKGMPPTQSVIMERPEYKKKPKLIER